jgi:hypothetical protein
LQQDKGCNAADVTLAGLQGLPLSLLLVDHLERFEGINISFHLHIQIGDSQIGSAARIANTTSYMLNVSSTAKGVYVLEIRVGDVQVAQFAQLRPPLRGCFHPGPVSGWLSVSLLCVY